MVSSAKTPKFYLIVSGRFDKRVCVMDVLIGLFLSEKTSLRTNKYRFPFASSRTENPGSLETEEYKRVMMTKDRASC